MSEGFEAAGSQSGEITQPEQDAATQLKVSLLNDFGRLQLTQQMYVCELVKALAEHNSFL